MVNINSLPGQARLASRIQIIEPSGLMEAVAENLAIMHASTYSSVVINSDERKMFVVDVNNQPCQGYVGAIHPQPFSYGLYGAMVYVGVFVPLDIDDRLVSPNHLPERNHDAAPLMFTVRLLSDNPKQGSFLDYEILDSRLRNV